jgi:hypothetical protein
MKQAGAPALRTNLVGSDMSYYLVYLSDVNDSVVYSEEMELGSSNSCTLVKTNKT